MGNSDWFGSFVSSRLFLLQEGMGAAMVPAWQYERVDEGWMPHCY